MSKTTETQNQSQKYTIPILGTFPGMNPELLEAMTPEGAQALLLESNAHAAVSEEVSGVISRIVERGIPVVILADVYGENHGITHIADEPQQISLDAGAFFLETMGIGSPNADDGNQNNIVMIVDAVKEGIEKGLVGQELGKYIANQFKYPEGKKPPRPNHLKQLREQHERLIAMGLGGLSELQLEKLEEAEREELGQS